MKYRALLLHADLDKLKGAVDEGLSDTGTEAGLSSRKN